MPFAVVTTGTIAVVSISGRVKVIWVDFVPTSEMGTTCISYSEFLQGAGEPRLSKKVEEIAFGLIEDWEYLDEKKDERGAVRFVKVNLEKIRGSIDAMQRRLSTKETG